MIVYNEHLPSDITPAFACFGNLAPVTVMRVNEFNLTGRIPGECVLLFNVKNNNCTTIGAASALKGLSTIPAVKDLAISLAYMS